jgi:endonuclease/exonuclease/phosphatase family metal-dependent hydrolase
MNKKTAVLVLFIILIGFLIREDAFPSALATVLLPRNKAYFDAATYSAVNNCDGRSPCTSGQIKVMTLNVFCRICRNDHLDSWDVRLPYLLEIIRKHDVDLLGLQELGGQGDINEFLTRFPNYAPVSYRFWKWTYADSVLLYKTDRYELLDSGQLWLSPRPTNPFAMAWHPVSIPRYVNWAYLRRKDNGFRFLYLNTHFDNHKQNREQSARLFAKTFMPVAGSVPIVATGDFNLSSNTPEFDRLQKDDAGRVVFHDAMALAATRHIINNAPGEQGISKFYTNPARAIDHILLAGPATKNVDVFEYDITRYGAENHQPSDHPIVYAEIGFTLNP